MDIIDDLTHILQIIIDKKEFYAADFELGEQGYGWWTYPINDVTPLDKQRQLLAYIVKRGDLLKPTLDDGRRPINIKKAQSVLDYLNRYRLEPPENADSIVAKWLRKQFAVQGGACIASPDCESVLPSNPIENNPVSGHHIFRFSKTDEFSISQTFRLTCWDHIDSFHATQVDESRKLGDFSHLDNADHVDFYTWHTLMRAGNDLPKILANELTAKNGVAS